MIPYPELKSIAAASRYPLIYVTISGAHLYGFPSADSDFDLRGAHLLPLREVVGLKPGPETIEQMGMRGEIELDLVTYDAARLFQLMLKKNGYVLEQILSDLVVTTSEVHQELIQIARNSATRFHAAHYRGFAHSQWKLFSNADEHRVKPLLYTFRVLLTGIHLMKSGEIEPNLVHLNADAKLPYLEDLIAQKRSGAEKAAVRSSNMDLYQSEIERLFAALADAEASTHLPLERPELASHLNDLLLRLRLGDAGL
jgi:uncharacterized protein